jgi:hypothetical protein
MKKNDVMSFAEKNGYIMLSEMNQAQEDKHPIFSRLWNLDPKQMIKVCHDCKGGRGRRPAGWKRGKGEGGG